MANIEIMTIKIKRMIIEGRKKLGVHPVLAFRYLPTERQIKELKKEVDDLATLQKEALLAATKATATIEKKFKGSKRHGADVNEMALVAGGPGHEKDIQKIVTGSHKFYKPGCSLSE